MDNWFAEWVWSGRLIDFVIGLMLIEAAFLMAHHRITRRGLALKDYVLNISSGLFLMLALRAALAHSSWIYIAAWLTVAGVAHFAEIASRWHQRRKN
jgi:hypothetical protein